MGHMQQVSGTDEQLCGAGAAAAGTRGCSDKLNEATEVGWLQQRLQQAWHTWLLCRRGLAAEHLGQSQQGLSGAGPSMCRLDLMNKAW